jgi:hypothetical protein
VSTLIKLVQSLAGLFVDDGSLAIAILCIVTLAACVALLTPNLSLVAGVILLTGCLIVLFTNAVRSAQQSGKRMVP